ncbi:neutral zinc metallopeptidase [Nonomuraea sp. NPDC049684]|uniref:neutral zinc metallopeptidase n=1 Tax=Nonomuraea sp. NPDC049684 TaxID=3364356 RepID=UPI0037AA7B02
MRFATLVATATLTCLLLSSTPLSNAAHAASAFPIRARVLTANKLYRTGELRASQCAERDVGAKTVASAKRYLTAVLNCLNRSWGAHFKRAGLPFAKAKIGFITKPRKYCGWPWGSAAATYCDAERRFLVLLDDDMLDVSTSLFLFETAVHEYGHHVQNLTGIARSYDRYPYRNKSELNEQNRRMELQAECLGGVFFGSVWDSLTERSEEDWKILLQMVRDSGDEQQKIRSHGKGSNRATWLDKGFRTRSPQACNTWTVSSSQVS